MTRVIDFLVDILERLGRLFGIGRRRANPDDPFADPPRSLFRRLLRVLPILIVVVVIGWGVALFVRFCLYHGLDLNYPQQVLAPVTRAEMHAAAGGPGGGGGSAQPPATAQARQAQTAQDEDSQDAKAQTATAQDAQAQDAKAQTAAASQEAGATGEEALKTCAPSALVAMQIGLIDRLVNQNVWVPGSPMYRLGFFGVVDFADTPWFDNKASLQTGMLNMVRRVSLDLADTLGRVRGTSTADPDLQAAQSRLRTNERAWVLNSPFDDQLQTVMESAGTSYRGAIPLYQKFNQRLAACDALFDVRRDNLRDLLDRLSADMGSMASRLANRSQAERWSVQGHDFVPAQGNNYGWFDFKADNLFHEARGELLALHGLMQAARIDFKDTIATYNLDQVWDRMESHLAEGARLDPMVVSNGREDGAFTPDHLAVMGEKVLRARANMTELRDILTR